MLIFNNTISFNSLSILVNFNLASLIFSGLALVLSSTNLIECILAFKLFFYAKKKKISIISPVLYSRIKYIREQTKTG